MEAEGFPTLSMTSAWSITAAVNPPRAAFTDFPLGHTCGPPGRPALQQAIAEDALALFETLEEPGVIADLGYSWAEEWKEEARRPVDHRTPRLGTPQYQNREDERAAVRSCGPSAAGGVCAPPGGRP